MQSKFINNIYVSCEQNHQQVYDVDASCAQDVRYLFFLLIILLITFHAIPIRVQVYLIRLYTDLNPDGVENTYTNL